MHHHPDIHLVLLRAHSAELRRRAARERLARAVRAPRPALSGAHRVATVRRRLGWVLVETGLRLVHSGRGVASP